ncbi:site-specific integrase [Streptomyces sp. ISL-43]|uniref:site-specific integrase n=1 Tax=Streptomyces sp. ISL-43 TaxID=2819183 RepID=UPI001BE9E9F3|nr:tyrosine-type recombinase/integrase [Streptomyces sp. ISL-43]MBT2450940.1 site-specific integrase [Streptomyces sp. ISL-43]
MAEIKKVVLQSGKTRYRTVVDAGHDETGKRIQLTITRDTITEVKNERARVQAERASGTFIAPNKITLTEWLDQWLEYKRRDVEETTIRTYRLALIHVYDRLGGIRLQELTEDHVRDFVDEVIATGRRKGGQPGTRLAVSTVEGILTRLREALGRAVVRRMVGVNVASEVRPSLADKKTDKRERTRAKPWSVDEVQAFLQGTLEERLFAPLLLSLMGLRPAEVCGMKWADIDLEAGLLSITQTRTMMGNHTVLEKDTKTAAGERALPLPRWPWAALKALRARQDEEKEAAGDGYTDTGYVAVNELGIPLNTRQFREYAYGLMEAAGLRRVRLYDARHSTLKAIALSGVPDVILAAWAGHTNAALTKRKYVSIEAEDMRAAADALDVFYGGELTALA